MYYNSNKASNDYYNSYKQELSKLKDDNKEKNTKKIIKLILSLLTLVLFILLAVYLYKHFNPIVELKKSTIGLKEELPVSIQLDESRMQEAEQIKSNITDTIQEQKIVSSINKKDIALIVQIIMSQMNTKIEKPLEKQLQEVNNKVFVTKPLWTKSP